jgi:chromosome segregation ATPase
MHQATTRERITREEVHAAAHKLNGQGIKPSTLKIREMLGKGSYTTIGKHLEDWTAPDTEAAAEAPDVPEALQALLPQIWQACYGEAQAILQAQADELLAQLTETRESLSLAQKATDEAEEQIEQLQAELDAAQARAEKAETDARELDRLRLVAEARATELQARAEAAEKALQAALGQNQQPQPKASRKKAEA